MARLVRVFSPLALVAVATLAATGLFASVLHLESAADLFTTAYGRRLGLKLVLVAGVMALGAFNWRRVKPRLEAGDADASVLLRSAATEIAVGALVLLVTAVLVVTPPPGE